MFTRDWSDASPVDHTLIPNIPSTIRAIRVDLEDRLAGFISGFVSGDTLIGIEVAPFIAQSTPTPIASQCQLYGKIFNTKTELTFQDQDGHELQITSGGKLNKALIADVMFPVGSLYFEVTGVNPNTTYGVGTWIAWGTGRVPVGVDPSQTEFATVELTGGEKTHQLTVDELASHAHQIGGSQAFPITGGGSTVLLDNASGNNSNNTGEDTPHNNLQPYITCYVWKRTA